MRKRQGDRPSAQYGVKLPPARAGQGGIYPYVKELQENSTVFAITLRDSIKIFTNILYLYYECSYVAVWRRDEYWAKARRAFRLWDPGAEDSCVGGWDPRSWLGNHLPSPSWFWPASLKIFMSDESLQEKRCGGWGKERKAEERPESERTPEYGWGG